MLMMIIIITGCVVDKGMTRFSVGVYKARPKTEDQKTKTSLKKLRDVKAKTIV